MAITFSRASVPQLQSRAARLFASFSYAPRVYSPASDTRRASIHQLQLRAARLFTSFSYVPRVYSPPSAPRRTTNMSFLTRGYTCIILTLRGHAIVRVSSHNYETSGRSNQVFEIRIEKDLLI